MHPFPETGRETSIDLGVSSLATLAGRWHHDPQPVLLRTAEASLRRCQRRLARRKRGSNRPKKAVELLAKAHQHIRNQRRDFQHKTALWLVRAYDRI